MDANENAANQPVGPLKSPATVLLLGSDPGRKDEIKAMLKAAGYRAAYPPDANEALKAMGVADLLILMADLPGEAEFNWLSQVRETVTACHVPVLLIVDKPEPAPAARCVELGAEDCLAWPVDPTWLLARVSAGVQRKKLWESERQAHEVVVQQKEEAELLVSSLTALGLRMVGESDPLKLLETILVESMRITDCEGGTIYAMHEQHLRFVLVRNDMMDINMGGSTGKPITFHPLKLYDEAGKPVHKYVSCYAALTGQTVNVADAYVTGRFDFSGTRAFDQRTGYHSQSFLTIPIKNQRQAVIGVLQLINARDSRSGKVGAFNSKVQPTIEAFSVLASAVLEAYRAKI